MSNADPPLELRVHGVGGPQARKMLGCQHEEDVATLPPFTRAGAADEDEDPNPEDEQSRFARRIPDDRTEAYEWGGLTTGSWIKALWVLYLPFTLINAGGWAHHAADPEPDDDRQPFTQGVHLVTTHVIALLGTVTYVLWIGYLLLDLTAVRWWEHVQQANEVTGTAADWADSGLEPAAAVLFVLVVGLLAIVPNWQGKFEEDGWILDTADDTDGDTVEPPWPRVPRISDPMFFARVHARQRAYWIHIAVAGTVAAVALYLAVRGIHRLGALLWVVAAVQALVLLVMGVSEMIGRFRRPPGSVFEPYDPGAPGVWRGLILVPMGTTFALVGTAMAHAAFAGLAMFVRQLLADWPEDSDTAAIEVGPELQASDVLGWTLVLLAAAAFLMVIGLAVWRRHKRRQGDRQESPLIVLVARRAPLIALIVLVAFVIPVVVYALRNLDAFDPGSPWSGFLDWYDGEDGSSPKLLSGLGSLVLLALPALVFIVLRGDYETGAARVVGNIWDVLTFWPRRFHPIAVPTYAERAVPELRARVQTVKDTSGGLVVVGHSQGSVLAAAAIASAALTEKSKVYLVTIGSPLGTLYGPTWPAYIPRLLKDVGDAEPLDWRNYWRTTDPVGAGVPGAMNQQRPDPQEPTVAELDDAPNREPGERPVRWGTNASHGQYLSDTVVRAQIRAWRNAIEG